MGLRTDYESYTRVILNLNGTNNLKKNVNCINATMRKKHIKIYLSFMKRLLMK